MSSKFVEDTANYTRVVFVLFEAVGAILTTFALVSTLLGLGNGFGWIEFFAGLGLMLGGWLVHLLVQAWLSFVNRHSGGW